MWVTDIERSSHSFSFVLFITCAIFKGLNERFEFESTQVDKYWFFSIWVTDSLLKGLLCNEAQ